MNDRPMTSTMSEHSLVEKLGPIPPKVTAIEEAAVRRQITAHFPSDSAADRTARHELTEILFGRPNYKADTTPEAVMGSLIKNRRMAG